MISALADQLGGPVYAQVEAEVSVTLRLGTEGWKTRAECGSCSARCGVGWAVGAPTVFDGEKGQGWGERRARRVTDSTGEKGRRKGKDSKENEGGRRRAAGASRRRCSLQRSNQSSPSHLSIVASGGPLTYGWREGVLTGWRTVCIGGTSGAAVTSYRRAHQGLAAG